MLITLGKQSPQEMQMQAAASCLHGAILLPACSASAQEAAAAMDGRLRQLIPFSDSLRLCAPSEVL